jgi:uncharacterized protein YgiM (DUF1202 family)
MLDFARGRLAILALLVIHATIAVPAAAQSTATIKRNTNLRVDPSTFEDPIELLKAGTEVTLLRETPVERYYQVPRTVHERGLGLRAQHRTAV